MGIETRPKEMVPDPMEWGGIREFLQMVKWRASLAPCFTALNIYPSAYVPETLTRPA
jgi:hypothetical protein